MEVKRLFENFRHYINERVSDIVYHLTDIYRLNNILATNRFMTSVAKTRSSDERGNRGKFYYLSTARSKMSKYFQTVGNGYALLVLDGQKLSYKYRAVAVDYWGSSHKGTFGNDEMEDRIITDEPYIDDAIKYILEVNVIFDLTKSYYHLTSLDLERMEAIEGFLSKKNVPLFIYIDLKDFRLLNKKKAITSVAQFVELLKQQKKDVEKVDVGNWKSGYDRHAFLKHLAQLLLAIEDKNEDMLTDEERKIIYSLNRHPKDVFGEIERGVQNSRTEPDARHAIDTVFKIMRKHRITNIDQLLAYMKDEIGQLAWKGVYPEV